MSNCQEARGGGEPHIGDGLSCVLRLEDSRGAKMKTAFASHEAREVMQPVLRLLGGAPKTASKMTQRQRSRSAAAKRATEETECVDCKGKVTSTAQIALQSKIKDIDRQLQEALGFGIGHREEEVEEMLLGLALATRACSDCKSECSTLAGRPCATVIRVRERLDTAMTRAKCMQLIQDSNVCIMMHTCTARAGCVHMQEFVQTHQVKIVARKGEVEQLLSYEESTDVKEETSTAFKAAMECVEDMMRRLKDEQSMSPTAQKDSAVDAKAEMQPLAGSAAQLEMPTGKGNQQNENAREREVRAKRAACPSPAASPTAR